MCLYLQRQTTIFNSKPYGSTVKPQFMLSKISLSSLTGVEFEKLHEAEENLFSAFHELRQAHIKFASLLSDPRNNYVISESFIEDNATLFACLFDLERDYIKFIDKEILNIILKK